ncbi:MAG: hypothetical protein U0587_02630 [Candidatus Binatia bacterium]
MQYGSISQAPSSIGEAHSAATTDLDMTLGARHLRHSRRVQGVALLGALPLVFVAWVILSRALDLDVIFVARAAWLTAVPVLAVIIFAPLFLPYPRELCWRGYILHWFCFSSLWILIWEVPPVVYRSAFENVAHTQASLPYYIWWWGYFSSDLDYGGLTPFFVLAELSFWVIAIPIAAALVRLWRGRDAQAFALFGLSGALQFYNVCFFIGYGGIVERFANIATDSILAPLLYWILNGLWGLAGGAAAVFSFLYLFRIHVRCPTA